MYAFKRAAQAYVAAYSADDDATAAAATGSSAASSLSSASSLGLSSSINSTLKAGGEAVHKGKTLRVLAAGLPRCATSSLRAALEQLELGPCMHMARIYPKVDRLKLLCAAFDSRNKPDRQKLIHRLFDGYAASADTPGCIFVEDLVNIYPGVKIILNRRSSARAWLQSVTRSLAFLTSRTFHLVTYLVPNDYWFWHMHWKTGAYREQVLGYTDHPFLSEEHYHWHCENVRRIAHQYNLDILEFEPSMGWAPLCKFLGKPIPSTPFPHENEELVMKFLIAFVLARGLLAWLVVGFCIFVLYRYSF